MTWSPDGRWLATGSTDRSVALWDMGNPEAPSQWRPHGGVVSGRAVAGDRKHRRSRHGLADPLTGCRVGARRRIRMWRRR
ncbi:WD40 repeat domain-containing protein [Frankia sp. CH37]|nr:WD40 repeat domain-containing protein [Parafrankia sp. CH37]